MELGVAGRVAFITGANRGIGEGIAKAFAHEGIRVALFGRNLEQCTEVRNEIRKYPRAEAECFMIDFKEPESIPPAVDRAIENFGSVDILVNCAGGAKRGHFQDIADADWEECFSVKPLGLIRMTRAVLPHIIKSDQARIINLAGVRGREPAPFSAVAGPINAGTNSLTKIMAHELGKDGVTVNAINPGSTNTRRWQNLIEVIVREEGLSREQAEAKLVEEIPIGRVVEVEDITSLALFLASKHAKAITGTAINVDGGRSRSI